MLGLLLASLLAQSSPVPSEIDAPGLERQSGAERPEVPEVEPPAPPPEREAELTPEPPSAARRLTSVTFGAVGGVGAGLIIIPVPAPFAAPWLGFGLKLERRVMERSAVALSFDFSLGNTESGKPVGGYHLLASFTTAWVDSRFFVLESQFRGGLTSFLLIPLPLLGGVTSFILQPLRGEVFRWRLGLDAGLDFVLLLPVVSGGVHSELRWQLGWAHLGLKLGGGYSAGLLNGAGVSASVRLFGGASF